MSGGPGPLRMAVVGHVNTGKTSLIATLSRRTDLAISDGRTTREPEEIGFSTGGEELLVLVDTPGFELASEITEALEGERSRRRAQGERPDDRTLLESWLEQARQAARPELELDRVALEAACAAEVILYVVDVTQPAHERLRDEVTLLVRTARPVIGVLNFTAEPRSHAAAWSELLRRESVHAQVSFDVMVNDAEAEAALFRAMAAVLTPEGRERLQRLERAQAGAAARRRLEAVRVASSLLVDLVTLRTFVPRDSVDDAADRARAELERRAVEREREGFRALARAHGFEGDELSGEAPQAVAELVEARLVDPEALKRYGPGLLGLAAGGAAVGGTADLMLGGASFGLGVVIGGAVGLIGGLLRTSVDVERRGRLVEARLHPSLAWVMLARVLACHQAYRERTHARRDPMALEPGSREGNLTRRADAMELVKLLGRVGRDPELVGPEGPSPRRLAEARLGVELALAPLMS